MEICLNRSAPKVVFLVAGDASSTLVLCRCGPNLGDVSECCVQVRLGFWLTAFICMRFPSMHTQRSANLHACPPSANLETTRECRFFTKTCWCKQPCNATPPHAMPCYAIRDSGDCSLNKSSRSPCLLLP